MAIWYTIRVKQRVVANPEIDWSNTLEVAATTPLDNERAQLVMASCVQYITDFQFNTVEVFDATCSSWVQEEGTQPADELFTYEGDVAPGQRTPSAAPAPLEHTLHFTKVPNAGNKGKLFLRGALTAGDLTTSAKRYILLPASRLDLEARNLINWPQLINNLAGAGTSLGMVSYPRIGWNYPATPAGEKQKRTPVYSTEMYERNVTTLKVTGSTYLQLEQH